MTQTKTPTTSPKRMKKEETHMKAIMYSPDVLELKEEDMNHYRRTAVLVGALFLISTATFIVSNVLMTPILGSHNFLAAVADHAQLMIAATLIALIEGTATAGLAVALYPILKRQHPALALGYAGMRIAELAIAAVGFGLGGLLLVTLSATATNGASSETLGTLLVALRHWTLMLVYVYTALGGLMLSYMLLRNARSHRLPGVAAGSGAGPARHRRHGGWPGTGRARSRRPVRIHPADLAFREGIQLDRP